MPIIHWGLTFWPQYCFLGLPYQHWWTWHIHSDAQLWMCLVVKVIFEACRSPRCYQFSQFSHSVVSDSLRPPRLQHARLPCPAPTPRAYTNSCPSHWWCHPTISSSVIPFSHLQPFPASGSFQMSQFFASGGQNIGVLASTPVLPMNIRD